MLKKRTPGSRGFSQTWLEPFFGEKQLSVAAIAGSTEISDKTIQRIITAEKLLADDRPRTVRFAALVQSDGLPEKRDLSIETLQSQLIDAQNQFHRQLLHEEKTKQPVDSSRIYGALQACMEQKLNTLIDAMCKLASVEAGDLQSLSEALAECIRQESERMGELMRIVDQPLRQCLDDQTLTWLQIKRIESLVCTIASSCAVPIDLQKLQPGTGIRVYDAKHDWSIRLVIDAALGQPLTQTFPGGRRPQVHPGYVSELEYMESPNPMAQLRQVIDQCREDFAGVEQAIHRVLCDLESMDIRDTEKNADSGGSAPSLVLQNYEEEMEKYCEDIDGLFFADNNTPDHRFLYCTGEFPRAVRERLDRLGFESLRIVEVCDASEDASSLRVLHKELSGWLQRMLEKIQAASQRCANQASTDTAAGNITIYAHTITSVGDHNQVNSSKE